MSTVALSVVRLSKLGATPFSVLLISPARPTIDLRITDKEPAKDHVATSVFAGLVDSPMEAHWDRYRSLVLSLSGEVSSADTVVSLEQFQNPHLPNLRRVSLIFADCPSWGAEPALLEFLGNLPASHSLETLVIGG